MNQPPSARQNIIRFIQFSWAPFLAGVSIALLYWIRVDDVFYFLFGSEGQGMLLARAISEGRGFIDLSLPGNPAHVREPPLFYLALSLITKVYGLDFSPMKVLMWAGYVLGAVFAVVLFQKRTSPLIALLSAVFCMSAPEFFRFCTGPKSDIPFLALALFTIIILEKFIFDKNSGKAKYILGISSALLVGACVFTRSLGLALLISPVIVILLSDRSVSWINRIMKASIIALPVVSMIIVWGAIHSPEKPDPTNYSYVDWFMMDMEADSPEMIAADFHAPLLKTPPNAPPLKIVKRMLKNSVYYPALWMAALFPGTHNAVLSGNLGIVHYIFIFLLGIFVICGVVSEMKSGLARGLLTVLFLIIYFGAVFTWPMKDPRLLYPVMPFSAYYIITGAIAFISKIVSVLAGYDHKNKAVLISNILVVSVVIILIGMNYKSNISYHMAISTTPTINYAPGLKVRFLEKETRDSYRLLDWISKNIGPGKIIMYHSPPPCHLFTGQSCQSIPFSEDLGEVRDYLVDGGADYIVLDEWGSTFTSGPGWFVENTLRPVVVMYPSDFEKVYEIKGTRSFIFKVNH